MQEDRTIGALRLTVPQERVVPRAVSLLEDALRTASLPPTGGRLVVVRRVDLGRVDLRRSSVAVADRLRDLLRAAWGRAVHGLRPGAERAEAVWFRSPEEAHAALLVLLLRAGRAPQWPWQRAVPLAFHAEGQADPRRVLASARRLPGGTVALARVVGAVARAGALAPLLEVLTAGDASWLAPEVEGARPRGALDAHALALVSRVAGSWAEAAAWGRSQPARAAEVRALAALALVADLPSRAVDPRLPALAAEVERLWRRSAVMSREPWLEEDDRPAGQEEAGAPSMRTSVREPEDDSREHTLNEGSRGQELRRALDAEAGGEPQEEPDDLLAVLRQERNTRLGGLLFLLAVLRRLGLAEVLERQPGWIDAELGLLVLRAAAERLGWPDDDPLRAPLALRDSSGWAPHTFVAPAAWWYLTGDDPCELRFDELMGREQRRVGPIVLAVGPRGRAPEAPADPREPGVLGGLPGPGGWAPRPGEVGTVAEAWVDAAEVWLARHAELTLAELVLRPARVLATRTHLDISLPADQIDVRVRRAGLDLDPGWVAWWARVVAFHYGDERGLS